MKKIILIGLIPVIIDQILKKIITFYIDINDTIIIIKNFFNLTYVRNYGAAFSILSGNRIFFIIVAFLAICLIFYLIAHNNQVTKLESILYGVLLGGIIGNLIDRILYGYVIDYLEFIIFKYHFPIFNFADICIVLSTIFIIIFMTRSCKNETSGK